MIGGGSLPQGSGLVDPPKLPKPDGTDPTKAIKERERLLQQVLDIELKLADAQQKGRVSAQDGVTASANRLALLKEEDPVKRIALEFDQNALRRMRGLSELSRQLTILCSSSWLISSFS